MLVDIKLDSLKPGLALLLDRTPPERISKGLYLTGFNFGNTLEDNGLLVERYPFHPILDSHEEYLIPMNDQTIPWDYGVCDSPEQLIEQFPIIESDPRSLIVTFSPLLKSNQPSSGGWRWHKWGPYIGTQEPQCEYLYDEPLIDKVYCYYILEVNA